MRSLYLLGLSAILCLAGCNNPGDGGGDGSSVGASKAVTTSDFRRKADQMQPGTPKSEVLKVLGMVNAVPEFKEQPKVINGCSDLFVAVLGERGRHARSAVGMGSLPMQITVEIEAVLRIHD